MDSLFGFGYPYTYPYYCCPTDSTKTQTNCNPWLWMANYNWPADSSSWTYGSGDVDMEQYLAYGMYCNSQKAEKIKVLTKIVGPSSGRWSLGKGPFAEKHFIDGNFLNHLSTATIDYLYDKLYVNRTKDSLPLDIAAINAVLDECTNDETDAHYSVLLAVIREKKERSALKEAELEAIPDLRDRSDFKNAAAGAYYPSSSSRSYYAMDMDEDDDLLAPRSTHTYRAYRPTNYYGSSAHNYYN